MVKDTDAEVHKAREKFITAGAADSQVVDFLTAADGVSVVDSTDLDFAQTVEAVLQLAAAVTAPTTQENHDGR